MKDRDKKDHVLKTSSWSNGAASNTLFQLGETAMGDKGSKDKGKKEQQKKALLTPKEKRRLKKEKKNK